MNKSKTLNSARAANGPTIIDNNPGITVGAQSARGGAKEDKKEIKDEEEKANPLDE